MTNPKDRALRHALYTALGWKPNESRSRYHSPACMRGQENCGGSVPEVEAIFQEICDLRKRLEEAEKELKFQRVFEAAFADKLKEFGTIDRLIEEYSAAKMARREAEKENARLLSALIVHREHAMHCPMLAQKPTE